MSNAEEAEEARNARRAALIWGNPFSPEAMGWDRVAKGPERDHPRAMRMRRIKELQEEEESKTDE